MQDFCGEASEEALRKGKPDVFTTDRISIHRQGFHRTFGEAAVSNQAMTVKEVQWTTCYREVMATVNNTRRCIKSISEWKDAR